MIYWNQNIKCYFLRGASASHFLYELCHGWRAGRFVHENKVYFVVMIIMCNFDMIKIEVSENEKI